MGTIPKQLAYLTMEDMSGWVVDTELGMPPLEALGWAISAVPWRSAKPDWNRFDAVFIGTPWDYQEDPARFLAVLESIDRSRAVLVNDLSLVRWSISKSYLRQLEQLGVAIVPSLWYEQISASILDAAFDAFQTDKVILKPAVSASATDTIFLDRAAARAQIAALETVFCQRSCLIQPFIATIRTEGEYSLLYFNGEFSHAVRKLPQAGDFRVQEEFGASIEPVQPEIALQQVAENVLHTLDLTPAYARVDFVRNIDNDYLLMELELIEPSMYLRTDPEAPGRFATAIDAYVTTAGIRTRK